MVESTDGLLALQAELKDAPLASLLVFDLVSLQDEFPVYLR